MTPDRWQVVKGMLCAALEQDPQHRERWLQRACAGDETLQREVHSLIAAHDGPADFLDAPVVEHASLALPATDWTGRIVGRYRILDEIGRGGMSAVFRAARLEEQFEHEVAIKLLHRSHDPAGLMRRFRAERQILARLSHPNIAHLLDGASTEDGVPYLIMEYVRGEPIDAYCERRRLGLAARLRLFRTLCDAVHHVHRHLMVHGDIKCSNVLVNEDGIVKLLDFGIARLLDPEHGSACHAHTCTIALTPESASPEQIRGEPLTTASDIYSLGILLHRLLTGQPAYEPDSDAYYELTRHICEQPPRRPSLALEETTAPYSSAQLRGDLDNIVLKALHKDPERRYGSVELLSQDIAWHLGGFPIAAAPESRRYRLQKFVGRNRALVAVGMLFGLSLVIGIVATSWQAHVADRERQRAQRHFDDVRGLAQTFMLDVHDSITSLPGTLPVRGKIIGHSLRYLDELARERADDPEVRRDLARAYERIGDLQGDVMATNLGNNESALVSLRRSRDMREALWSQGVRDDALLRERLLIELKLAQYSQANRSIGDALRYADAAADLAHTLTQRPHVTTEDIRLGANALVVRGTIQAMNGALDAGLEEMDRGIRIFEQQIGAGNSQINIRRGLANALCRRGDLLAKVGGRYEPAYPVHLRSFELFEALIQEYPLDVHLRHEAALVLMDLGDIAARTGRTQEGLLRRSDAVERLRALSGSEPLREELRFTLGWALGELAASVQEQGQHVQAARYLDEAQSLLGSLSGAAATRLNTTQFLMAINDLKLGKLRMAQADAVQASRDRQETLWSEAHALVQRSTQVFNVAKDDAVLAAEAVEHLRTAEAALHACNESLRRLRRV
ncbi:serine/threonine-protein kinase [Povalibacter sp.]|uniref:serine/threonine protein kinase n=1 Tax=Povalibacter sp. TaxID=1962978 RepID=UPI002F3E7984